MDLRIDTDATLPPGRIHTVRVATPNPDHARRHIQVRSGWPQHHVTACRANLPKDCCETGTGTIEEIDCEYCHDTREYRQAVEDAKQPVPTRKARAQHAKTAGPVKPKDTEPRDRPTPSTRAGNNTTKSSPDAQGSLF